MRSLVHDTAFATAKALVEILCLRPEEKREAFEEFYRVIKAGLEAYELQLNRAQKRLHPTEN